MKRGKVLVVVALGLSLALGGLASPSQGATGLQAAKGKNNHGKGHHHHQPPPKCSYPPVRTPAMWLGAWSTSVKRNETFRVSGTVKVNGCGLAKRSVGLFISDKASGPFYYIGATTSNNNGEYEFYRTQDHAHWFRTGIAWSNDYNAAMSNVVYVGYRRR